MSAECGQDASTIHSEPLRPKIAASLSAQDEQYLRRAIQLADAAVAHGNHPFGSLIVARRRKKNEAGVVQGDEVDPDDDGIVVVEAENTVMTHHDATGHAETNAIRALGATLAAAKTNNTNKEATEDTATSPTTPHAYLSVEHYRFELFTSTEPCMMCCGAVYWSFVIERVVYACADQGLAKFTGPDFLVPCRENFAKGSRRIVVEGPFLEAEAEALHAEFWPKFLGH